MTKIKIDPDLVSVTLTVTTAVAINLMITIYLGSLTLVEVNEIFNTFFNSITEDSLQSGHFRTIIQSMNIGILSGTVSYVTAETLFRLIRPDLSSVALRKNISVILTGFCAVYFSVLKLELFTNLTNFILLYLICFFLSGILIIIISSFLELVLRKLFPPESTK